MSRDAITALAEKAGVPSDSLIDITKSGDLYMALNKLIKEKTVDLTVEEKVVEPTVVPDIAPNIVEEKGDSNEVIYIVKPGDWLSRIATKYNKQWEDVAKYNSLKNPHLIFPGQEIKILVD